MHAKNYAKKLKNYYANNEKSGKKFGWFLAEIIKSF